MIVSVPDDLRERFRACIATSCDVVLTSHPASRFPESDRQRIRELQRSIVEQLGSAHEAVCSGVVELLEWHVLEQTVRTKAAMRKMKHMQRVRELWRHCRLLHQCRVVRALLSLHSSASSLLLQSNGPVLTDCLLPLCSTAVAALNDALQLLRLLALRVVAALLDVARKGHYPEHIAVLSSACAVLWHRFAVAQQQLKLLHDTAKLFYVATLQRNFQPEQVFGQFIVYPLPEASDFSKDKFLKSLFDGTEQNMMRMLHLDEVEGDGAEEEGEEGEHDVAGGVVWEGRREGQDAKGKTLNAKASSAAAAAVKDDAKLVFDVPAVHDESYFVVGKQQKPGGVGSADNDAAKKQDEMQQWLKAQKEKELSSKKKQQQDQEVKLREPKNVAVAKKRERSDPNEQAVPKQAEALPKKQSEKKKTKKQQQQANEDMDKDYNNLTTNDFMRMLMNN